MTDYPNFEPALKLDYKILVSDPFKDPGSSNLEWLLAKVLLASSSKFEGFFDGKFPNRNVPWGAVFYKL